MTRLLQNYIGQIYYGNTELANRLCIAADQPCFNYLHIYTSEATKQELK